MWKHSFVTLSVLAGLLLSVESCSWVVLKIQGQSQPFFLDLTGGFGLSLQAPDSFQLLRHVDPLLGWGYDSESIENLRPVENEYAVLGAENENALRLVITGGSTSDSFGNPGGWPARLTKKLNAEGYCVKTFVGAVPSYNSSQEHLKILRDQAELRPDLHLSYSGVNENSLNWDRLPQRYQADVLEQLVRHRRAFFLPNSVWLLGSFSGVSQGQIRGVNLGLRQPGTEAQRWMRNLRMMKSLSQEFGYEFVGVLQPILGVGRYHPDATEQKRIADMKLVETWGPFYEEARGLIANQKQFFDFVDIFADKSGLYSDDCHVVTEGNEIIAQKMFALLKSRQTNLLTRARIPGCRVLPSFKEQE